MKTYIPVLLIVIALGLNACSSDIDLQPRNSDKHLATQGGAVEVKAGDTVYSVARKYNVPMSTIIRENHLTQPYVLQPGQSLKIPGASLEDTTGLVDNNAAASGYVAERSVDSVDVGGSTPYQGDTASDSVATQSLAPLPVATVAEMPADTHSMVLTPTGPVTTPKPDEEAVPAAAPAANMVDNSVAPPAATGAPAPATTAAAPKAGTFASPMAGHASGNGSALDVSAPKGTAVTATAGGTVTGVTADSVTIQHANGYLSTYSPLERVLVDKDVVVAKGDAIGTVAGSGKAAQLHFTLAKDGQPVDAGAAVGK